MNKTWKPTTAGILNIITGAFSAIGVIWVIVALVAASSWAFMIPPQDLPFAGSIITTVLVIVLVLALVGTVFPIVGGVFALQRKRWGWALAGSIIAIFGFLPLGILSTIWVAMAKDEFGAGDMEAA
jgi:hypothetical protein